MAVKRRIGYVPEAAALYDSLTPMEYLRFVGRLYGLEIEEIEKRAREMLDLFELSDETENRLSTFSKGMRQKVLIVAGMIHNPYSRQDHNRRDYGRAFKTGRRRNRCPRV